MAETDPFGRSKDEDSLAEMGWTSSDAVAPGEGAADVAAPETPDRAAQRREQPERAGPPGTPPPTRGQYKPGTRRVTVPGRRGGCGCATFAVALFFIVVVASVVIPVVISTMDAVDTIEDAIPDFEVEEPAKRPEARKPAKPKRPPRGLAQASMLRRGNLAPALKRLERITNTTRVRLIRIDAETVIVQAAVGNRTRLASASWKGEAQVLSTSPGGTGSTFPWSRIDPSAPNRIVRAATRGRRSASFDYLVMLEAAGLRWSAFLRNGAGTFQAQPDGSGVSKVG